MPKKTRVYTPYGFPAVEQIIMTARKAINRDQYQLLYFTAGSVPDAYAEMPEDMTPDQIQDFENRFNNMLTGNAAQRKQVPFLPAGSKINQLKEAVLTDAFDEWMARIVTYALGLPPNAFVKQQNRATAGSEQDRALEEGQAPRLGFIKNFLDLLIADFGPDYAKNIEAKPREKKNQDAAVQETVLSGYTSKGLMTIDEARAELGYDPLPNGAGAKPMAFTPTGYVPLDAFEQNQQMQQENMKAQADAKAAQTKQAGTQDHTEAGHDVAGKSAYGRLGKAVRHPPIPFVEPSQNAPSEI